MRSSIQSFLVGLLSLVLLVILLGLSFLIFDRLVLQGRYTSPYNKDEVIKSLGERLNLQIQENNQLKQQIQETQSALEMTQANLESIPSYELTKTLQQALSPNCGIRFDRGRVVFGEQTFFKSGSEALTDSAKKGLNKIALHLLRLSRDAKGPWVLRIEGHADRQMGPSDNGYGSNWMVSYKRAYAVCQYLISKGVDAKRFYIAAFSNYAPGPYPHNRRVSLSFDYR